MILRNILYFFFLLTNFCVSAQELPPIQNFSPVDYKGENQNWDISQSPSGLIYIANNKGLLAYNGASWKLYPSPNESIVRSVRAVGERIYSGSYMEFGYWEKDSLNILKYTSLSKNINVPLVEDEEFWNIKQLENLMIFQSKKRIYILDILDGTVNVIESQSTIPKIFRVGETIYFQRIGEGIFKFEYGQDTLVNDSEISRNEEIISIFSTKDRLRFLTQNRGFYDLIGESLSKSDIASNQFLSTLSFYDGIRLKDDRLLLGTISNGLIWLDKDGEVQSQINQDNGLPNNTVLSLYEDRDSNIWLGLDNGISFINTLSPYKVFNDNKGILGSVYTSAIHRNKLYLGTNQGLFYKTLNTNDDFKFIEGTQGQVWNLKIINATLFCAHHTGTFIVNDTKVDKIANIPGTWDVSELRDHPELLLQGNYTGLYVLEKSNGIWKLRNKIQGFNKSSRYFETLGNTIFVNHEYNGVFKLVVDDTFYKIDEFEEDTSLKGANSGIINYRGEILYAYKGGIFRYDLSEHRFERDSLFSAMYDANDYQSGKMVFNEKKNKLWVFTKSGISFLSYEKLTNTPRINEVPLTGDMRKGIHGYENILSLDENDCLIGTTSGYITVKINELQIEDFYLYFDQIKFENDKDDEIIVDTAIDGDFKSLENSFRVSFYVPIYNKLLKTRYQYQLLGESDDWSDWSEQSTAFFENLPYGSYTFNAKAKIGDKISTNTISYNFKIAKPWYISNVMLLLYLFGLILFSFMMHNIYKRYYERQRKKLIDSNKQKLVLAQVQSEKEIIRINNNQLNKEFKAKSKELASSTMSIIKKNELLITIKEELSLVENKESVKAVIQTIDNSLKQSDNWELFKEAFNNADSEFFNKVKALHPSVSPNDLKLCAYLRLNLSSKEIAQLLRISPRSVEIKRYRLRKKLRLNREDNLVNYLLAL